jgi:hypothetical protein
VGGDILFSCPPLTPHPTLTLALITLAKAVGENEKEKTRYTKITQSLTHLAFCLQVLHNKQRALLSFCLSVCVSPHTKNVQCAMCEFNVLHSLRHSTCNCLKIVIVDCILRFFLSLTLLRTHTHTHMHLRLFRCIYICICIHCCIYSCFSPILH